MWCVLLLTSDTACPEGSRQCHAPMSGKIWLQQNPENTLPAVRDQALQLKPSAASYNSRCCAPEKAHQVVAHVQACQHYAAPTKTGQDLQLNKLLAAAKQPPECFTLPTRLTGCLQPVMQKTLSAFTQSLIQRFTHSLLLSLLHSLTPPHTLADGFGRSRPANAAAPSACQRPHFCSPNNANAF